MHKLPFNIEQLAEARTFEAGFRGAWFRCKIKNISKKKGILSCHLEYIDYPDQKKLPAQSKKGKSKITKRQLMVRPWFPPIYLESEKPNISTISGGVVVVNNAWNVGDLVDWWSDGCFWAGQVTEILENDKVKVIFALGF
ncbi:putative Agenet-like domain-containing protein [Senna tora]|uniref:Putative Agenet-like domain-containing protein n=1 Tax=Senna tora TaxID=362788 RepID=A0A834TMA3_9FABA|nr:putative Agenet-like domain-containing protein [Senna tora]